MEDLNRCRAAADGSYYQHMDAYKTVRLLIVDDFMTTPVMTQSAVDLFEIMEELEGRATSTLTDQTCASASRKTGLIAVPGHLTSGTAGS